MKYRPFWLQIETQSSQAISGFNCASAWEQKVACPLPIILSQMVRQKE